MSDANKGKPIVPIRFSARQLAGKDLEPAGFLAAKVRGNPREIISPATEEARMAVFFEGDVVALVYEIGPTKFRSENTLFDESIQVLAGSIILTPKATGESQEFSAGDHLIIPKGFSGVIETVGNPFRELVVVESKTFAEDDMAE